MTWAEQMTFNYALGILEKHGITIYNEKGEARPADKVLHELVQLYISGNLNPSNLTK